MFFYNITRKRRQLRVQKTKEACVSFCSKTYAKKNYEETPNLPIVKNSHEIPRCNVDFKVFFILPLIRII